ncbi:MAG: helix-turn-helix transcriptional regulator [Candidatus Marinimicrobia bacterium]|nr:helix-turn-helix transcriptional regulator [Candidatus Neomarinimicrobiota bacterium]
MTSRDNFGAYLRKWRLKSKIGLREFAKLIDMKPSNLCNIEYSRIKSPTDLEKLKIMSTALGFAEESEEYRQFMDLAGKSRETELAPDLVDYALKQEGIPILLRTLKDTKMDAERLSKLADYIRSQHSAS